MFRKPSRVAQQAREAKQQAAALEKKIRQLSTEIANPQKYLNPPTDDRSQSAMDRFRRYFRLDQVSNVERRKPTRMELRAYRNRAIFWTVLAFILLIWIVGQLVNTLTRHEPEPTENPPIPTTR
jgi:hypothetical protein